MYKTESNRIQEARAQIGAKSYSGSEVLTMFGQMFGKDIIDKALGCAANGVEVNASVVDYKAGNEIMSKLLAELTGVGTHLRNVKFTSLVTTSEANTSFKAREC